MRILVTGGAGFIGSHLVDELVSKKHHVTVIDNLSSGRRKNVHPRARLSVMDIRSPRLFDIFNSVRPQIVFHLAAQKSLGFSRRFPLRDAMTNIIGSLRLIELSKKHHVRKFVFYSTAAVYDPEATPPNREGDVCRPVTPYGIAKETVEQYLKYSGLSYVVLRLSNVYGPRQDIHGEGGVVAIFFRNFVAKKQCNIMNTGRQTRDFIYVSDIVAASFRAMSFSGNGLYNISTAKETSINELYSLMSSIAGFSKKPLRGKRIVEQYRSAMDSTLARRILGWKPSTTLSEGLRQTFDWFYRSQKP